MLAIMNYTGNLMVIKNNNKIMYDSLLVSMDHLLA